MKFNNKGFTLLEVTIVTLIVGFIALLIAPTILQKNRIDLVRDFSEEINWMCEAIRRFYMINHRFPDNPNELITQRYIPELPSDPFFYDPNNPGARNISFITLNRDHPEMDMITIVIRDGIALTDYTEAFIRRVPYARRFSNNEIHIYISEITTWVNQEIVYTGIHKNNDEVFAHECIGGLRNRPFASIVGLQGKEDTPIYSYRAWIENTTVGTNAGYKIKCGLHDGFSLNETDDCLVWHIQICH